MRSKTFYRPASGMSDYELEFEHEPDQYVPKWVSEDDEGWVQDLMTDKGWESLAEMTQDLQIVLVSWGSDVGD